MPLIKNIHKKNHALKIIITTNTVTGAKIVNQQNLSYLFHSYLPFDWIYSVNRFLSSTKPAAIYVMETEIWPNLVAICNNKNIAINIINARLSKKTTSAKPWIKKLIKNSLLKVNNIYARSEDNAIAFQQLGAAKNSIQTIGNLKLTTAIPPEKTLSEPDINRKYILVASTHNDEELQIYNSWKSLHRNELLIIVPRHPERSPAISKQLKCEHIAFRSKEDAITEQTEIFILDTVGELKNYFNKAEVVIMGGSFVPIGGHNILEPASFNKAIITGPYMGNFKEELELMLSRKAIIQVETIKELITQLTMILSDEKYRTTLQNNTTMLSHNAEEVLNNYTKLLLE